MDDKYLPWCLWKRFPLHFSSWEAVAGELSSGQPAPPSAEVGQVLMWGFLVCTQLFIPPARTACLPETTPWDCVWWPQLAWASRACAVGGSLHPAAARGNGAQPHRHGMSILLAY